ncbi:MAG: hypothetical protein Q4G23_01855 [Clostridia bacterium]|nr:hypothetical protein [Clostridia bacterium]
MELLDAILTVTGCECEEQLKDLTPERKLKLAQSLEERVPSGLASIEEWNELLKLFMESPPEKDNEIAKKKLLCHLRGEEYKEEAEAEEKMVPERKKKWWFCIKRQ